MISVLSLMIMGMIEKIWRSICTVVRVSFSAVFLLMFVYFLFLINVFTIPITLIFKLVCRLAKKTTPRFRLYGLMLYPSWKESTDFTLRNTLKKISHKRTRKREEKDDGWFIIF